MFKVIIKGFIWYGTISLILISCVNDKHKKKLDLFCPFAENDHLEYWNYGVIIHTDGSKDENEAYNIYEVIAIEKTPQSTVVQFKNYYSDTTGMIEEYDIKFIYEDKRVYFIRHDNSIDSLKFVLGDNRLRIIEDYVDSLNYHHIVKIEANDASVQTRKGRVFDGCLKLLETIHESGKSPTDFIFQKISYYKDTILITYMCINRMEADKGIKEFRTESHLEGFKIAVWR